MKTPNANQDASPVRNWLARVVRRLNHMQTLGEAQRSDAKVKRLEKKLADAKPQAKFYRKWADELFDKIHKA